MKIKGLILIIITGLIQGCATVPSYQVTVNSINANDQNLKSGETYVLLSSIDGIDESDLQFQENAKYVNSALQKRGYVLSNFNEADLGIFLGYGISEPETSQYTYSLPTYGQTGISSSNTYGTISTYGGTSTYSGTTTYTPTYGVTGSTTHTGTSTNYFRHLFIDAIDLAEYRSTENQVQVWKTTVTSSGSSGDLRRAFPVLVAASLPYIGTNTEKNITVRIRESDQAVLEIKGEKVSE